MKTIRKMYEHLNWANQRILDSLQSLEKDNHEVRRLFSHILLAEKVWITRLRGSDGSQIPLWSEADMETCAELVQQNAESYTEFLDHLATADLDKVISYTNSKGKAFKNSLREILTHVALHGQYHRGQINLRLRANGFQPIDTDFITFVR
ncbi:DinB family protein [Bacillaceae bacterium]